MDDAPPDVHPLALELQSLRASVARFQDEAHTSAVKLQRHSLDSVRVHERAVHLERENDVLKSELVVLRDNPSSSTDTSGQTQVQELTLSLRRLSQKLTLTESSLLLHTTSLASAQADAAKASANADNAYALGARVRGREEEALARERELAWKVQGLEERLAMEDGVVREYAALVRGMEARSRSEDSAVVKAEDLTTKLDERKAALDTLLAEFQGREEELHRRVSALQSELEVCRSRLDAEKTGGLALLSELGQTKAELEKLRIEDNSAAKMVSRYMQFSQSQTNTLLSRLSALQTRHSATLSTLSSQNATLSSQLSSLQKQNARLLSALDELGGEVMKESYGRRREVALRIKMGGREDRVVEGLRRWVRRGEEVVGRVRAPISEHETLLDQDQDKPHLELDALLDLTQHARILLESLDDGVLDEESALALSGGKARGVLLQTGLQGLLEELRVETERRVLSERRVAEIEIEIEIGVETGRMVEKEAKESMKANGAAFESEDADALPPEVPEKLEKPLLDLEAVPSSASSQTLLPVEKEKGGSEQPQRSSLDLTEPPPNYSASESTAPQSQAARPNGNAKPVSPPHLREGVLATDVHLPEAEAGTHDTDVAPFGSDSEAPAAAVISSDAEVLVPIDGDEHPPPRHAQDAYSHLDLQVQLEPERKPGLGPEPGNSIPAIVQVVAEATTTPSVFVDSTLGETTPVPDEAVEDPSAPSPAARFATKKMTGLLDASSPEEASSSSLTASSAESVAPTTNFVSFPSSTASTSTSTTTSRSSSTSPSPPPPTTTTTTASTTATSLHSLSSGLDAHGNLYPQPPSLPPPEEYEGVQLQSTPEPTANSAAVDAHVVLAPSTIVVVNVDGKSDVEEATSETPSVSSTSTALSEPQDASFTPSASSSSPLPVSSADSLAAAPSQAPTANSVYFLSSSSTPTSSTSISTATLTSTSSSTLTQPSPLLPPLPPATSTSPSFLPSELQLKSQSEPEPVPEPNTRQETEIPKAHPLLADLARVSKRYDDLQRAFRDCHLALEGLKASLGSSATTTTSNTYTNGYGYGSQSYSYSYASSSSSSLSSPSPLSAPTSASNSASTPNHIPTDSLRAALARLDDYTEDARVELEIRVGDEVLLAKGYEALLCVPGALSLGMAKPQVHDQETEEERDRPGETHDDDDTPLQSDVELQIAAFVSGTDPAVRKAREVFERKLEDVQHDIAALKRAVHDPESLAVAEPTSAEEAVSFSSLMSATTPSASSSSTNLVSPRPEEPIGNGHVGGGGGGGWTSWIRGASSSRPSSPAPALSPAPLSGPSGAHQTFGSIMTSPRLRHSPSAGSFLSHNNQGQGQNQRPRKGSFFGFGGTAEPMIPKDPLAPLGLRVPMPSFGASAAGGSQSLGSAGIGGGGFGGPYGGGYGIGMNLMSPTSPLGMGMGPVVRNRTVSSTMYMLGLGAASAASPGQAGPGAGPGTGGRMVRSVSAGSAVSGSAGLPFGMRQNSNSASSRSLSAPLSSSSLGQRRGAGVVDEEVGEVTENEDTDVE